MRAEWSPDDRSLLTSGEDKLVILWDAASGERVLELSGHTGLVYQAVFSPSGRFIASVSDDGSVRVWDATDGVEVARSQRDAPVYRARFVDDERIVSGNGRDGSIMLWDWRRGAALKRVGTHKAAIWSLEVDRRHGWVLSGSDDRTVALWTLDGKPCH